MYMTDNDWIFVSLMSLMLFISFTSNSLLLYLIIYKSPASLTPYRIFLADTAITQLLFVVFGFFTQPRILSAETSSIIINLGPVQFFNAFAAVLGYFSCLHSAWNSFISLMLAMLYRYLSIRGKQITSKRSVLICLAGCVIPLLNFLASIQIKTTRDSKFIKCLVGNDVPDVLKYNLVVATDFSIQPEIIPFMAMLTANYIPLYIVMFWCRHKIHKKLKETSAVHSSNTKETVKKLVTALTLQSLCPLVSFFPAAISNAMSQSGFVQSPLLSYFLMPTLSLSCVADPILSILYIQPYRRFVFRTATTQNQEATRTKSVTIM